MNCSDRVGSEFDHELLNRVLDALAVRCRNADGAIVFTTGEFALHKHVSAFDEPIGQLREALAESDHVVPLSFLLPGVILVLPGALGGDREFGDWSAIRQRPGFGVLADKIR